MEYLRKNVLQIVVEKKKKKSILWIYYFKNTRYGELHNILILMV